MTAKTPEICDFACPHAEFPPADSAGICRTMSAVWCKQLKELVNKNMPCEWERRRRAKAPSPRKRTPGPQKRKSRARR